MVSITLDDVQVELVRSAVLNLIHECELGNIRIGVVVEPEDPDYTQATETIQRCNEILRKLPVQP